MRVQFSTALHAPSRRLGAAQVLDAFGVLAAKPTKNVEIVKPSEDAANLRSDWKKVGNDIRDSLKKAKTSIQ